LPKHTQIVFLAEGVKADELQPPEFMLAQAAKGRGKLLAV